MSEEESRQFQDTVQAMQEVLDRIRERVDNLQKNLSEEFLKNAKVETLRFDRVSTALSRLTQALQQKNGADALAAAKDVLEQLREMERQLNRASESLASFVSETEAALTEEQNQLKKLIQRQEALLDRTLDWPADTGSSLGGRAERPGRGHACRVGQTGRNRSPNGAGVSRNYPTDIDRR